MLIKRPWDYNFTHFRYQNFGIVPEWFIVKFQAKNDYWAHPWSFKKSVLLVSSHPKASHPLIWKIFRKRKSQFLSSYYSSITVIFHVAYTYKSSKFFAKRPGWFVIKKSLVWRLRDFSSVANLPGSPVPELKSDLKIQIFISNLEDWGVKLHWSYNKTHLKIALLFWDLNHVFNHLFFCLNGLFKVVQCKLYCKKPIMIYSGCSTASILDCGAIWSHPNAFTTPR